jgi:NitT/TauT family transport system substrate-binding protein
MAQYESGELRMDPQKFGVMAHALMAPVSYFFLTAPVSGIASAACREDRGEEMLGRTLAFAASLAIGAAAAHAEVNEVTLVRQPAFGFLPLVVMQADNLVEKHAREAGLGDLKVRYVSLNNGAAVNDGLLSHSIQVAAGGLPPFLTMWDRTQGSAKVKALRAVSDSQQYLITRNPRVHSIADFGDDDRINVQAPRAAMPAILLQMAAAQAFGMKNFAKLDRLTVGMPNADSVVAMLAEKGQITADFVSAPFTYRELDKPGNHVVLKARDLTEGPVTTVFLYASSDFYEQNPKTVAAILAAYDEAVGLIERDRRIAAEAFQRVDGKAPADLDRMIADKSISFSPDPHGIMKFAAFMHEVGLLKAVPAGWQETFFAPEAARFHGD